MLLATDETQIKHGCGRGILLKEARKTNRDANCANEHELGKGIGQKGTETEITAESPRRRAKRTLERSGEWSGGVMSQRMERGRREETEEKVNREPCEPGQMASGGH